MRKMNEIVQIGQKSTMTSLEIAEVTGKQHAHIMRDIRSLLDQGVNESNFGLVEYKDKKGETRPMYRLTKKGCLILASGYDAVLREKIINRWEELEMKERQTTEVTTFSNDDETIARAMTILQKRLEIAKEEKAALEQRNKTLQEDNKTKGEKILVMKPKAEYFDALVDRNMLTNFTDTAKQLGLKRKDFIEKLIRDGYLYRDNKNALKPYAQYADTLFEIRDGKNENNNWAGQQTLITPKGKETFRLLYV